MQAVEPNSLTISVLSDSHRGQAIWRARRSGGAGRRWLIAGLAVAAAWTRPTVLDGAAWSGVERAFEELEAMGIRFIVDAAHRTG